MSFENNKTSISKNLFPISINDLRDKYYEGENLSDEELLAIQNYDAYRIEYLNTAENEDDFDKRYRELQIKANLNSFKDFL